MPGQPGVAFDPMRQPQQTQPMQLGRMQTMEQLRGGIFGGRETVGVMGGDDIRVGNFGPHSVQRRHGGFAPNIPNVPDGSSFPGGPPPGGPPPQEIGDLLPGKPPRPSPWQPPGRRRMPQPNQGYGDRFGGLQFSGPFAQPMMPRNYGMGGGYGQRPMPMPQPRYPHFTMHGGMGGGYGGGMGGGFGGGYGMPQRPPMYGGGFGGGFGGMGGGYGQMPQRPPMYGGGFGGGFGGMGGGYGQMPQPPMYGGGRGGFGGGYGMPQRPPMYGGGMGGGFEDYRRNFNDKMSRGQNLTRMMPDGSMVY